eukprot:2306051-Rhodomonas_salina.2
MHHDTCTSERETGFHLWSWGEIVFLLGSLTNHQRNARRGCMHPHARSALNFASREPTAELTCCRAGDNPRVDSLVAPLAMSVEGSAKGVQHTRADTSRLPAPTSQSRAAAWLCSSWDQMLAPAGELPV